MSHSSWIVYACIVASINFQLEEQSLNPLVECEAVLNDAVMQTQQLLQQGHMITDPSCAEDKTSEQPAMITKDRIAKFQKQAALNNWYDIFNPSYNFIFVVV